MYAWELTKQIFRDMLAHKVRSALALFGIVWGTLAVVLLLALGEGFITESKKNLSSVLDNTIMFFPDRTTLPYQGVPGQRTIYAKANDVLALSDHIPTIRGLSPILLEWRRKPLSHLNQQAQGRVVGVAAEYAPMNQIKVQPGGRFLSEQDIKQHRPVVFLGDELKTTLFGNEEAVGQSVQLSGQSYTVIGVIDNNNQTFQVAGNNSRIAYIPYTTYIDRWGDQNIHGFMITPEKPIYADQVINDVYYFLSKRFHFDPQDRASFYMFNMAETASFFYWFFISVQVFLALSGLLTLAVGGLGVTNIMFLIVRERTPEIGLRMALGAQPKHVMLQIMLEALVIVSVGALIGFLLAVGIVNSLAGVLPSALGQPTVSLLVMGFTFIVLSTLALLTGYFPAKRAVNFDPVIALNFK